MLVFINLSRKRKLALRDSEIEQQKLQDKVLRSKLNEAKTAILAKNQMLLDLEDKLKSEVDYTELSKKMLEDLDIFSVDTIAPSN